MSHPAARNARPLGAGIVCLHQPAAPARSGARHNDSTRSPGTTSRFKPIAKAVLIRSSLIKRLCLIGWACLLAWTAGMGEGCAADGTPGLWLTIESRHTLIRYQTPEDLIRFDRKLKYGPDKRGLRHLFDARSPDNLADKVADKVDALFERVQEILGMRPSMKKTAIFVHPDCAGLQGAYRRLVQRPGKTTAWYQCSTNAVYLNVADLHEGMLAHELARATIEHYFLVRLPAATAEILVRYVDSHLRIER